MSLNLTAIASGITSFLAAAPGAIQGHLNTGELLRIVGSSLVTGGASAVLPAILASVGQVVAPGDAALATGLATVVVEVYRRLGHGTPAPTAKS
jgi:hypothetical protein